MTYKGNFEFYCTFVEKLTNNIPITIPFNLTPAKVKALAIHKSLRFIHAGNWWTFKNPTKRSKEIILEKQMDLANENTIGFMSKNVQPGDKDLIDEEKRLFKVYNSQFKYDKFAYWMLNPSDLNEYYKKNIEYANWAKQNNRSNVPIYCSIQVIDYESAKKWFKKGLIEGHSHFCVGVSEFLKYPKFKRQGVEKLFEIALGIREAIGEKHQLHFSGVASLYLIPILAHLGVSSFDGSTPIQSALAYGTIFNDKGYSQRANALKASPEKRKLFWNDEFSCECETCLGKDIGEIVNLFANNRESRVVHNIHLWRKLIRDLNANRRELEDFLMQIRGRFDSNYFNGLLSIKDNIIEKFEKK